MKYALLIYDLPDTYDKLPDDQREAVYGEYFAISQEPSVVGGEQLQPVEDRHDGPRQGRRDADDGRPVRRHEGDPRRLLHGRG